MMENTDEKKEETPEEKKEGPSPEGEAAADTGEGKPVEPEKSSMLDQAKEVADRIEKGNKTLTENIDRLEKIKSDEILGGRSSAGQAPEKPKEMTDEEYANALLDGKLKLDEVS